MSAQSPIIEAIRRAEQKTTAEIRVHLSKKLLEKDAYARAVRLFHQFNMFRNTDRNSVLIYVNLRKRKFAVIGDEGAHRKLGQRVWQEIARHLSQELKETHPEKAIAQAVLRLGDALSK